MRNFLIILITTLFSTIAFAQKNTSLYTIENINTICLDRNGDKMFGITWYENAWKLNAYNLKNGSITKTYQSILPHNPVQSMIQDKKSGIVYLVTAKKIDESENQFMDEIYQFNPKNDKIKFLYKIKYNYPIPTKLGIVNNNIVFTISNHPTLVYDTRIKDLDILNQNTDYQLLNIAPEQNGYLMLNIRNIEGDRIPVYFMNTDNKIGDKIGYYHPNIKIASAKRSFQIPTISLEDESYIWIIDPIRYNCFPLYSFQITMRPFWLKQAYSLDKVKTITALLAANAEYLIAQENKNIIVYNMMNEADLKEATFSEEEIINLESFLSKNTYTREVIDNDLLETVFDAVFYKVYKQNKLKYIAVLVHGNYIKLSNYEQPIALFDGHFKLNSENKAANLQEALNIILPPDNFNLKHLKFYKKDNQWVFIRGSAFERFFGYEFTVDAEDTITKIKYITDL